MGEICFFNGIFKAGSAINRKWRKNDIIELNLPMPVRRVASHPNVKDNAGRTAIQRGPVVYCFEQVDNPQGVTKLVLPVEAKLQTEYRSDLLGGVVTIKGRGKSVDVVAIPYYAWAHRSKGEMAIWLPEFAEGGN